MVKFLVSGDNYFYHMEQWIEKDLHYMCGIGTIYHTKNLEMPYCRLEGIIYEFVKHFSNSTESCIPKLHNNTNG